MNAIHLVYWFVIWFASALYYAFSLSKVARPRKPNCRSFSRFTAVKLGRFQCLLSKTRLWDLKVRLLKPGCLEENKSQCTVTTINCWPVGLFPDGRRVCLTWIHQYYRLLCTICTIHLGFQSLMANNHNYKFGSKKFRLKIIWDNETRTIEKLKQCRIKTNQSRKLKS